MMIQIYTHPPSNSSDPSTSPASIPTALTTPSPAPYKTLRCQASAEGPSGDEYYYETRTGWTGRGITLSYQVAPAALAVAELWLRLFAFVIAPVALAYIS